MSREPSRIASPACLREFTSAMAVLLGIPLDVKPALDTVGFVAARPDVRIAASLLSRSVASGESFSVALSGVFPALPRVYAGLVAVGERTGNLARSFARLDAYLSATKSAHDRVSGALVYPAFVAAVAIAGLAGLCAFVLPSLSDTFSRLGGGAAEEMRASISGARTGALWAGILLLASIVLAAGLALTRRMGGEAGLAVDAFLLSVPGAGKLFVGREMLDFCFAMEALLAGSIPPDRALVEAARVPGNSAFARDALASAVAVSRGKSLSEAFSGARFIPPLAAQWAALGERSGDPSAVFSRMRAYYEVETERFAKTALSLVEPGVSLVLGLLALAAVSAFILPVFRAYGSLL